MLIINRNILGIFYICLSIFAFLYWKSIQNGKQKQLKIIAMIFLALGFNVLAKTLFLHNAILRMLNMYLFNFIIYFTIIEISFSYEKYPNLYFLITLIMFGSMSLLDYGLLLRPEVNLNLPLFPLISTMFLLMYTIKHFWEYKLVYRIVSFIFFSLAFYMWLYFKIFDNPPISKVHYILYVMATIGIIAYLLSVSKETIKEEQKDFLNKINKEMKK